MLHLSVLFPQTLHYIVSTGDVSDQTIGFGLCALFSIAGIIFLVMGIIALKEYLSERKG